MSNSAQKSTASRRIRSALAGATVLGLTIAGATGFAAIAAPGDDSEALGEFVNGNIAGFDLDNIADLEGALAENPSGTHPTDAHPLTLAILNAIDLSLQPINLLGENGIAQLGAASQFAVAEDDGDAYAGSGAVTNTGPVGIDIDPTATENGAASIELSGLLGDAGADELIQDLSLQTGALAAVAAQEGGGTPTSEYLIADLGLNLESSAVGDLYTTLQTAVNGIQTSLNGLLASLNTGLEGGIGLDLPLGTELAIDANLGLTVPTLSSLLPTGFIGTNGVQVDLSNGAVQIDLAQIIDDLGPDINNQAPNTNILTGAVIAEISSQLVDTLTDILEGTVTAVTNTVNGIALSGTVDLDATVVVPLATVTATIGGTLAAPTASIEAGGIVGELLTALGLTDVLELTSAIVGDLTGVIAPVLTLVSTLDSTVDTIVEDLADDLADPLTAVLDDVLTLTVNVQPTAAPINGEGDLGAGSFTVRALSIGLLPGVTALATTLDLASATVRGTAAAADPGDPSDPSDPSDPGDPGTDPGTDPGSDPADPGDPSDPSDTDPADPTGTDPSDGLANTGSTTASLVPFGVLLLIAGAGAITYVVMRRRNAEV